MALLWLFLKVCLIISQRIDFIPQPRSPPPIRQNPLMVYMATRNSIIIFGGGCSDCLYNDLWEFSLDTFFWEKILPLSLDIPSARSDVGGFPSLTESKLYIFGGITNFGYQNDLWAFDFITNIWDKVETYNTPYTIWYRFTYYVENNIVYFVIFTGGRNQYEPSNLYRLNTYYFWWEKLPDSGYQFWIQSDSDIKYYYGNILYTHYFYQSSNDDLYLVLYSYSLTSYSWTSMSDFNFTTSCTHRIDTFIYIDELYLICKHLFTVNDETFDTLKISLIDDQRKWNYLKIFPRNFNYYFILESVLINDLLYIFGSFTYNSKTGFSNAFGKITLENLNFQLINDHFEQPPFRSHHSMVAINTKLYIFGGVNLETVFNDIWTLDLITESWESVLLKGDIPSQRYHHSAGSEGDIFVIWGGTDFIGLKDDMFIFNSITQKWTGLKPISLINPSPTKGACMVVKNFKVFVYGGERNDDISNELWVYDIGTNQFKLISSEGLQRVSSPYCWIDDDLFYVSLGNTEYGYGSDQINFFNFSNMTWHTFFASSVGNMNPFQSLSSQVHVGNYVISIGGQYWYNYLVYDIIALGEGQEQKKINHPITFQSFAGGFVYFGKILYVYGGGRGGDYFVSNRIGNPIFAKFYIEDICNILGFCEALCSEGTFISGNRCEPCKMGTFSDKQGSLECQECGHGTFNNKTAATSISQCIPCDEGTYNNQTAAEKCILCPNDSYCPTGSINPSHYKQILAISSSQPLSYKEPGTQKYQLIMLLVVTIATSFAVICCLVIKKLHTYLKKIDLYELGHEDPDIYVKKNQTIIGGIFTSIFIVISLLIFCTGILTFTYANIDESKYQVPLIIKESEISSFESKSLSFKLSLYTFGGQCEENSTCASSIAVYLIDINCSNKKISCSLDSDNTCAIQVTCEDGEIKTGAEVDFNLTERFSYTSGIQVTLTASSSIPNEDSSVSSFISPSNSLMFIGFYPSKFYFLATPSWFYSESDKWKSDVTGYHLSESKSPSHGSQHSINELPSVCNFYVKVLMEINPSMLVTERTKKQDLFIFGSAIIGAISGIYGIIGFIMGFFEKLLKKFIRSRKNTIVSNIPEIPDIRNEIIADKSGDVSGEDLIVNKSRNDVNDLLENREASGN